MLKCYRIGNAQIIGRREVQSNYFTTAYNDNTGQLLAVLADGSIDHPNGRKAAILAVELCVDEFFQERVRSNTCEAMLEVALKASKHIEDTIYTRRIPKISLTIALLKERDFTFFNVGGNRLYLYNGHNERVLNYDMKSPYSGGTVKLDVKNMIGIYSVGVYSITHPVERIKIVESNKYSAFDKAQTLIETVEEKALDNQLNATALLIEVKK